ncbi:ABC transporter ATP-binding protein [Paenibacillus hodogayensis]|uniref:ABC transporter ATP-binding protein n=1 Tax=Paenibacillus hodogayensis TaxID=279208 RepID=A0ABV5W3H4_9BACL
MSDSAAVRVLDLCKSFGSDRGDSEPVLSDISFSVEKGELVSLLGQSGCGKSTLLNMIGGFEKQDSGQIVMAGQPAARPNRKCVMLFQHYGLLPWRTVLKNVELGLEDSGLDASRRRQRARDYLRLVGLDDKQDHFPRELSGGMQQRVALARALALEPEIILMDEPFAALDTFTRYYLQDELLRIRKQTKMTIILVTHDIDEAVYLSDRILIMSANPGRLDKEIRIQAARPRDRGDGEFQHYRKQILEQFHFDRPPSPAEYSI